MIEDSLQVEVEDSGPGITPEQIGRIFVPFERLETAPGPLPGTGLGLALTKLFVEGQGGQVGVRSIPGEGSVFWAVLLGRRSPV